MAMQSCRECPLSNSLFSEIEYRSGFSLERGLQKVGILGTLTYPCAKAFRSADLAHFQTVSSLFGQEKHCDP